MTLIIHGKVAPLYTKNIYPTPYILYIGHIWRVVDNKDVYTYQNVYLCLVDPDFVSSYETNEYIYFFFRESAVELMNCEAVSVTNQKPGGHWPIVDIRGWS